jgi:peptide/nickel transport system ATP-binding protein
VSLLEVKNLSVSFGSLKAVDGVGFSLERGERFGIIGESGSGKSLTALAVASLLPDSAAVSGRVLLDAAPLPADEKAMARLRGKRIGMVFQEPMTALNPLMKAGAQIAEAVDLNRPARAKAADIVALLAEVGLQSHHGGRYPHELSGGQRQRVMIAMALASQPDLLIADEPTSALDLITQRRIIDLIAEICSRRGMALIFISHDLRAVAALCSRVMVIKSGRVVETGPAKSVFSAPSAPYTRQLVAASRPMIATAAPARTGAPLLAVRNLEKRFAQPGRSWLRPGSPLIAVNAVSFSIRAAESVALVGPSGCGKTTLARMIVGLERASNGEIDFVGHIYHGTDLPKPMRRDVSLVFQDPFGSFDPRLVVGASVAEPLRLEPGLTADLRLARLIQAVEAVGLSREMLDRYPHEFSGGQRQRLAIARALVTRPKLVVLDEPVSALDVSVRGEVLALLNRLRADFGLAYLVISHDLEMVRAVADRVMVMDHGQIVETGTPTAIFDTPRHPLTRELIGARLPDVA